MMKRFLLISILGLFWFSSAKSAPLLEQRTLKIAKMDVPDHVLISRMVAKAYQNLQIPIEFVERPGKRALIESSTGKLDAELSRIFEIGEQYPSLVRVPTSVYSFEPTVYSHKRKFKVSNWTDLKKYRIGVLLGMYFTEESFKGFARVTMVDDLQRLYRLLDNGRVDLVVDSEINGRYWLKKQGLKNVKTLAPRMPVIQAYHYLHEKNKDLVPKLDREFLAMKASGEIEAMKQQFLSEIAALSH